MLRANDTTAHASRPPSDPAPQTSPRALASYVAGWIAIAAAAAALGLLAVRTISPDTRPLRRANPLALDHCVARPATSTQRPPMNGGPSTPARSGVYRTSPPVSQLVAALRRGVVIVQYRSQLPRSQVETLQRTFGSAARLRIVTPDATNMPYAVAGTAWGRLIGCRRLDADTLAALKRFAARYQGQGPDAQP